jgi:hypothetical protein
VFSSMAQSVMALQWGRSLGSCGNLNLNLVNEANRPASMGPQPWELRKLDIPHISTYAPRSSFNGAAALGAAETKLRLDDAPGILGASMGPQPWELRKRPSRFILQK